MTNELLRLIEEQAADDTYRLLRQPGIVSLDAPCFAEDTATLADEIGITDNGELVAPRWRGKAFRQPWSAESIKHGTVNGYSNRACRCQPCRDAWAAYHRAYMVRRTGRDVPRTCQPCGREFLPKRTTQRYCSRNCNRAAYYRRHIDRKREYDRARSQTRRGMEASVV